VPAARLFEEVLKLFMGGTAATAYEKLRHYDLFAQLFPDTDQALAEQEEEFPHTLVLQGLLNTDARVREGKPVTPAFLFAVLLWEPVRLRALVLQAEGLAPYPAFQQAAGEVLQRQLQQVSLPKRFSIPMREIWSLQSRFEHTRGKRPARLVGHPRFRAAYDFLLLRAQAGEVDQKLADWWTDYQQGKPQAPQQENEGAPRKRRRRGGRRRHKKPTPDTAK